MLVGLEHSGLRLGEVYRLGLGLGLGLTDVHRGHVELQWGPGGGRMARFRVPTWLWGHEWSACMLLTLTHYRGRHGEGHR